MASHGLLSIRHAEMFSHTEGKLRNTKQAELSTSNIFFAIITTYNGQSRSVEIKTRRNVLTLRKKA